MYRKHSARLDTSLGGTNLVNPAAIPSDASIVLHGSDLGSNGTSITRWVDNRSTANPSFFNSVAGQRPVVATVSSIKCAQFDGVDDALTVVADGVSATANGAPSLLIAAAEYESFIVYQHAAFGTALANTAFTVAGHKPIMQGSSSWETFGSLSVSGICGAYFDSANRQPADAASPINTWNVIRTSLSAAHVLSVQTNGNAALTANGTGNLGDVAAGTIRLASGSTGVTACYVASVVTFKRALLAAERTAVYSVLNTLYGVTVP